MSTLTYLPRFLRLPRLPGAFLVFLFAIFQECVAETETSTAIDVVDQAADAYNGLSGGPRDDTTDPRAPKAAGKQRPSV